MKTILKRVSASELKIKSFCTASNTSVALLNFPSIKKPKVVAKSKIPQIHLWELEGLIMLKSENILNTKMAESTEVIRKPTSNNIAKITA